MSKVNCKHDWKWQMKIIDGVDCYSCLICIDCKARIHMQDIENIVNLIGNRVNQFTMMPKE